MIRLDKKIDLSKSVYELCRDDKRIAGIMKQLGFDQIADPVMLNTVGRFMTIPKGAIIKKVEIESIKKAFLENGYVLKNGGDDWNEN